MCCSLLGPSFILHPCCIAVIIAGWIAAASGRLRWWWWWWWHVSRRQLSRQSCHTTSFGGLCWNTCYNTPLSAIEKNRAKFVRFKNPRSQGIELFTEVFSRSFEYSTLEKEREGSGGGARGCRRTIRWRRTLSSFQHDVFSRPGHAHRQPRAGRTDRPWGYKQVVLQDRHHRWHDTDTLESLRVLYST